MKVGQDSRTGKYFAETSEGAQEISAEQYHTERYKNQFKPEISTPGAIAEGYMNRAAMPLRRFGALDNDQHTAKRNALAREQHPIANIVGDAAAYLTPGFGLAGNVAAGVGSGGWLSAEGEALKDMTIGGAGSLLGDMSGRILGRLGNMWKNRGSQLVDEAGELPGMPKQFKDTGGNLRPAQSTQNADLQVLDAQLSSKYGSAGVIEKADDLNRVNTNRKAMQAMGLEPGTRTRLSDDLLVEAKEKILSRFRSVAEDIPEVQLGDDLSDQIRDIAGKTRQAKRVWRKQTGMDIPDEGAIDATGAGLMRIRTFASKRSTSNNENLRDDAIDLIEQIDNLIESISDKAPDYKEARNQWRTLMSIDKRGSINAKGNINPTSAYGKLRAWDDAPGAQGVLRDNVQAASALELPFGNSGTGQRTGNPLMAPANWLSSKIYTNTPDTLLPGAANAAGELPIALGANIGRGGLLNYPE